MKRVCLCRFCLHAYERVCVGARLASRCLLFYTWAGAQPFSWHVGDTRGPSGRWVLCSSYKLLLSKTNQIGLLKGSRGVEVTFQSTLSDALDRTMMCLFVFLNQTILYCHPLEWRWVQPLGLQTQPAWLWERRIEFLPVSCWVSSFLPPSVWRMFWPHFPILSCRSVIDSMVSKKKEEIGFFFLSSNGWFQPCVSLVSEKSPQIQDVVYTDPTTEENHHNSSIIIECWQISAAARASQTYQEWFNLPGLWTAKNLQSFSFFL